VLQRFLSSLQLGQITPYKLKIDSSDEGKANDNANTIAQPPPIIVANDSDSIYKIKDLARKATIVWNPQPDYTENARKAGIQGVVRISAVLSARGNVINIIAQNSLPDGLTEKAIEAARHITFLPAEKEGKLVSQYVTLEYNFHIY